MATGNGKDTWHTPRSAIKPRRALDTVDNTCCHNYGWVRFARQET